MSRKRNREENATARMQFACSIGYLEGIKEGLALMAASESEGMARGTYPVVKTSVPVMMAGIASHHVENGEISDAKRFIECTRLLLSYQGAGRVSIDLETLNALYGLHHASVSPFVEELGRRLDLTHCWPIVASVFFFGVSRWPLLCLKALRIISNAVGVMQPPLPVLGALCSHEDILDDRMASMKILNLYAASGCIKWELACDSEPLIDLLGPIDIPEDVKRHVASFL